VNVGDSSEIVRQLLTVLKSETLKEEERISSDELDKLRLWLTDTGRIGERADGVVTVADLAEAFSIDAAEVLAQLRQIRSVKAFAPTVPQKKSQIGLLILAVGLMAVAGFIIKSTPRRGPMTESEVDEALHEVISKPKKIVYPVQKLFKLGDGSPPEGYLLEVDGQYVIAKAEPPRDVKIVRSDQAEAQLAKSLEALLTQAEQIQNDTPAPPAEKLLAPGQAYPSQRPHPDEFLSPDGKPPLPLGRHEFIIRENESYNRPPIRISGRPSESTALQAWRQQIAAIAHEELARADGLQRTIGNNPVLTNADQVVGAPPGFGINLLGKREAKVLPMRAGAPIHLPLDKTMTAKRLELTLRAMLRQDFAPLVNPPSDEVLIRDQKLPMPAFSKVEVFGPNALNLTMEIPTERSSKYPTAADVAHGQEDAINEFVRRMEAMIDKLNAGGAG